MDSPISGLFAEIKLRPLEERILAAFDLKLTVWHRFVDDIFIVWENNLLELYLFFNKINELDENIKVTLHIETDGSLPFLDVNLIKKKENLSIDRNVYRKPIKSNNTIPYNSSSPFLYKIAAYKFYIRRAFKVCSDKYLEKSLIKSEISLKKMDFRQFSLITSFMNLSFTKISKSKPKKNDIQKV